MPIPVYKVLKPSTVVFVPTEFINVVGSTVSYITEGFLAEKVLINNVTVSYITTSP